MTDYTGRLAVLFVHGLGGSSVGTWSAISHVISTDDLLSFCDLHYFEYPTSLIRLPFRPRSLRIQDLSVALQTKLAGLSRSYAQVVVVAHSLGGLIARTCLLDRVKRREGMPFDALLLYGTPNSGAALAAVGRLLSWRQHQVRQMCKASDFLHLLNVDWAALRDHIPIPIVYVAGGQDRVVGLDSAGPIFDSKSIKLVSSCNHLSLIRPNKKEDLSYIILRDLIIDVRKPSSVDIHDLAVARSSSTTITRQTPLRASNRLALFSVYSKGCEPYYLFRQVDQLLEDHLTSSNIWVSGPSGVGKTAAITRQLIRGGNSFHYVNLAPYAGMKTAQLLRAIYEQLCERFNIEPESLGTVADSIRLISTTLQKSLFPNFTLFIEEIPSSDLSQLTEFIDCLNSLIILHTSQPFQSETYFIFSSIYDPQQTIRDNRLKLRERVNFVQLEPWDQDDLLQLVNMIGDALSLSLNSDEVSAAVDAALGSPRFIKMLLRTVSQLTGSFHTALRKTVEEHAS